MNENPLQSKSFDVSGVDLSFDEIDGLNAKAWDIRRSDLNSAWSISKGAETVSSKIGHQKGIAESYRTQGYCLWRFGDYSKSLEKSLLALELFRFLGDKKGEADTLNSIGAVYMYQGDNENRLRCNLQCLKIRSEVGDKEGVAASQNNIGETYMEMGNYEMAHEWFDKCLKNTDSTSQILAWAFHNKGCISFRHVDYSDARFFLKKSLEIADKVKYDVLSIATRLLLARVYIGEENFNHEPEEFLNQALNDCLRTGIREEIHNVYQALSQLEEKRGNTAKAFNYFKCFHKSYEELCNDKNNQTISNLQIQYEIEAARKEAEFERKKQEELELLLEKIDTQKTEITQKNREITDSILYASRIQLAALTKIDYIKKYLAKDFFIFYQPKDIVSGDFYWATRADDRFYLSVCDSTGHGVPGAFMSLLNISYMNEAINEKKFKQPDEIFNFVRRRLISDVSYDGRKDGMDGALLCFEKPDKISYAAAYNCPLLIRDHKIVELKADKMPVGKGEKHEPFVLREISAFEGDMLYLYSDGYGDQFGGPNGKKFKQKQLKETLATISNLALAEQHEVLCGKHNEWKCDLEQIDDILIVGIRI